MRERRGALRHEGVHALRRALADSYGDTDDRVFNEWFQGRSLTPEVVAAYVEALRSVDA